MLHLVNKSLRKRKIETHTKMASPSTAECIELPKFAQFAEFHEDICMIIISFIADGPYEQKLPGPIGCGFRPAALTTSLPLVNKTFNSMSNMEFFWRPALLRQLENEDVQHLWKGGLSRLLPSDNPIDDHIDLLEAVREHLGESITHKEIYKRVFTQHIKFEAPIFIMPCNVRIGEMYGLHLFEPRYRMMIQDLLDACANPEESRNGGKIRPGRTSDGVLQPPLLLHACLPQRMRPGELACLVQVVFCRMYDHGAADVQLLPMAWVRMDSIWVRPHYGHLFYAKATRI
jgi:hypothetical protein